MQKQRIKQSLSQVKNVLASKAKRTYVWTEDDLINAESAIGRNIFGEVPEGSTREFFFHQKNVWIWYENGVTIRYEVRPNGVFKKASNSKYHKIEGQELHNFHAATKNYLKLIKDQLYD